ncbi:cytosol aminopeptidase-like [Oncorhynchus tshawytscha]|uniref:cytosol aminopeptidase-like n=1 Tax=Oncorhynchus tshawytscha TaxID=74940 RepID=UPI001C3E4897|nr:cytosol aminopeptidase-like [Oncorhynchus tshawytscha]
MRLLSGAVLRATMRHRCRYFSVAQNNWNVRKGLVLGVYESEKEDDSLHLTESAAGVDRVLSGKLTELLKISGPGLKKGKSRVFYGLHEDFPCIAVVGLGRNSLGVCGTEYWDTCKENIRAAIAGGCRVLQNHVLTHIEVDGCNDSQSAAEGAVLGLFTYDDLKTKKKTRVTTQLHGSGCVSGWEKGVLYGEGQNLARYLMEAPANHVTPSVFADTITNRLAPYADHVTVHKRSQEWIEEQQMGAFLSVSKGDRWEGSSVFLRFLVWSASCLLEASSLVCILSPRGGQHGRRGRLILADALCYAHSFNPRAIVNAATLTGAMDVALGSAATGVFTNSDWLWEQLHKASVVTGDRVWRMPLFQHYTRQVTDCQLADLNNVGKYSRSGGACTAAAFLREFVTAPHWAHLDIAGVMTNKDEVPYLKKGMSGRPTRTLVEFAAGLANQA